MIQSGWVGRQNGRSLSWGGCIYKIEIDLPIYRFFRYFFFFGIRYFSVFGISTSVSISVFWNTPVFGIGIRYRPMLPCRTSSLISYAHCAITQLHKVHKSRTKSRQNINIVKKVGNLNAHQFQGQKFNYVTRPSNIETESVSPTNFKLGRRNWSMRYCHG